MWHCYKNYHHCIYLQNIRLTQTKNAIISRIHIEVKLKHFPWSQARNFDCFGMHRGTQNDTVGNHLMFSSRDQNCGVGNNFWMECVCAAIVGTPWKEICFPVGVFARNVRGLQLGSLQCIGQLCLPALLPRWTLCLTGIYSPTFS